MNQEDLKKYKAMRAVINSGKFEIKGDAIITVASLFDWFNKLENHIAAEMSKPALSGEIIENLEEPKDGDKS